MEQECKHLIDSFPIDPKLVVITTDEADPASKVYMRNKQKAAERVGIKYEEIILNKYADQTIMLSTIRQLNADSTVSGIIVQLPLPAHINEEKIINSINPDKDVDAFHPYNVGKIMIGNHRFLPCTPAGVMKMLEYEQIPVEGKECVVVGRSNIVGKPMANLMMQKSIPGDATVTVCHSHTQNIAEECRQADIIIAALGQPHFLKADMVKEGAVVIDVGTTRVPDATRKSGFRLCGDVDFENVAPKCSFITPVPGGVGPMTIVSLMRNTLLAGKREIYK